MKKPTYATLIVILILIFTKVTGLLRDALAATIFGATGFSDSFFLSLSIVLTLYNLIGKAITLYLIPKFKTEDDFCLIKSFIVKGTLVSSLIIGLYLFTPDSFMKLLYSGDMQLIKPFFTSAIVSMIFVPSIYTLVAYYQSKERFYISTVIGLLFNVVIILFILIDKSLFKYSFFITLLIQAMFLFYFMNIKKIKSAKVNKMPIKELIPITTIALSMAFEQINVMIDRKFISNFGVGELTFLDLGGKVSFMFMGVIVLGITTVLYPKLSHLYHEKKREDLMDLFKKSTFLLIILSFMTITAIVILGDYILRLLFVHGAMSSGDVTSISIYLKLYIITILPLSIREMMMRFMVLREKSTALFLSSMVGLIINILITNKASKIHTVVIGSVIGMTAATLLLGIFFIVEMRKFKNERI